MIRRLFPAWSGCMHGILGPCDAKEKCLGPKGKRPPAGYPGSSFYNPEISDAVKESLIRLQLQRLKLLRHDGRSYEGAELRKKLSRELGFYHGPMLRVFRDELEKAGPDDESSVGKSEDSIIFEHTKQGL